MKELTCGQRIKVGDIVSTFAGFRKVESVNEESCVVRINKISTIQLPIIYNNGADKTDEVDNASYRVFRSDL